MITANLDPKGPDCNTSTFSPNYFKLLYWWTSHDGEDKQPKNNLSRQRHANSYGSKTQKTRISLTICPQIFKRKKPSFTTSKTVPGRQWISNNFYKIPMLRRSETKLLIQCFPDIAIFVQCSRSELTSNIYHFSLCIFCCQC